MPRNKSFKLVSMLRRFGLSLSLILSLLAGVAHANVVVALNSRDASVSLLGVPEVALLYVVLHPLERSIRVKPDLEPAAQCIDFLHTRMHRLGTFSVAVFYVIGSIYGSGFWRKQRLGLKRMVEFAHGRAI